jgi:uncharacterized protein (DUF433 family)
MRAPRLRFADFELDPDAATLVRGGRRVRIQPQPLRVLTILVERAGDVVSRDDLRNAVWGQATFVEFDQGLNLPTFLPNVRAVDSTGQRKALCSLDLLIRGCSRLKMRKAMSDIYVEQRDGAYVVAGTRVSLDSIAYAFVEGQSAETIAQAFPVLTLEQVYGAITYYLAHRDAIDQYLEGRQQDFAAARQAARDADPMFYQKLAEAKKQSPLTR